MAERERVGERQDAHLAQGARPTAFEDELAVAFETSNLATSAGRLVPPPYTKVEYEVEDGPKGPQARTVSVVVSA